MLSLITIGIPFYNNESTLADTLRSVFAQSFQDWELILLNDGSADGSLEIARAVRDRRVRVLTDDVNKGIGARRQQIIDAAAGELLAWQDADDLMHPDRLAIQHEYMQAHPSCGLVDNWTYAIDTENNIVSIHKLPKLELTMAAVIKNPCMLNGSSMGRVELYRANPYDLTLRRAEDWELWIRAYQNYEFGRVPQPLYFRRCVQAGGRLFEAKALRSLAYTRRVILKHGPRHIGLLRSLSFVAEHYARGYTRVGLSALGLQRLRPSAGKMVISDAELQSAQTALDRILATQIPGIDS